MLPYPALRAALLALPLTAAACSAPATLSTPLRALPDREAHAERPLPALADADASSLSADSTLDELIARAQARHPSVLAAQRRWESALERLPQVTALPEAKLALSAWAAPLETRAGPTLARLMFTQALPWPGRLDAAGREARELALVEAEGVRVALLKVEADARVEWTELIHLGRAEQLNEAHLELLRSIEAAARARYAAGGASYAELIRLQVEIGRGVERVAGIQEQKSARLVRLAEALAASPPILAWQEQAWPGTALPDPADLRERARLLAPEARRARARARAAAERHERARLEAKPDFTLSAEYTLIGADGVPGFDGRGDDAIAVTLGVDLATRSDAYAAAARQALADGGAAREEERGVFLRLDSDLDLQASRLRDAERRVSFYAESLIPKADEAIGAALTAYEAGTTGFQDLLDATRVLIELQLSLQRAHADRALAWIEISRLAALSLPITQ